MRTLIRQYIISIPELTAIIPAERWYGSRAVVDTPPRPFAEIRFGGIVPGLATVRRRRLEVWVHDEVGSYDQIDVVIGLLYKHLHKLEHQTYGDAELIRCDWNSDSTDLYDDGYRTNTKSTMFDIVGTGD